MRYFIADLNPSEREMCLAAEVSPDGSFNPWRAAPAEQLSIRVSSTWLPCVLNNDALVSYLQPIVDLSSGRTVAFESLVRAEFGEGVIGAPALIAAAKAHGALHIFDRLARESAIRCGAPQLLPHESLFVNFAPKVIYDPVNCLESTWRVAEETGFSIDRLVFEVVETEQYPQMDYLRAILDAYRAKGARVALDDLGAGATALSYIRELKPDIVKLDKALLPSGPDDPNIPLIEGVLKYSESQGITVLAEYIETDEQFELVRSLGIHLGQGYLFGQPARIAYRGPEADERLAA